MKKKNNDGNDLISKKHLERNIASEIAKEFYRDNENKKKENKK